MAENKRKEYSTADLEKLESGLNSFAEKWEKKPDAIKGKKPSVKVSIIKCSEAVKTLLDKGYTSIDIAEGLKNIGIEIPASTLKSYISDALKLQKSSKITNNSAKAKKTTTPKSPKTEKTETPKTEPFNDLQP